MPSVEPLRPAKVPANGKGNLKEVVWEGPHEHRLQPETPAVLEAVVHPASSQFPEEDAGRT